MNFTEFQSIYSPWYIIICVLAGIGYAWLLYQKEAPWSVTTNRILSVLRAVLVAVLCILLIRPFIRYISNTYEDAKIVVLIDNSASLLTADTTQNPSKYAARLFALKEKLKDKLSFEYRTLSAKGLNTPDSLKFDAQATNLDKAIREIKNDYEGKNLGGLILFTDGIVNQGASPDSYEYGFAVYGVATGDTVVKNDIILKNLQYNAIVYRNNKFLIRAELQANGFVNTDVNVTLKDGNNVLQQKNVRITKPGQYMSLDFMLDAGQTGVKQYTVQISETAGEYTTSNNSKEAYIEVVDSKEKILIVAAAPHPDIKALKNAFESNINYEVQTHIIGVDELKKARYDLVVLVQIPNFSGIGNDIWKEMLSGKQAILYVLGGQSNTAQLAPAAAGFGLQQRGRQYDAAEGILNPSFNRFTLGDGWTDIIASNPPMVVPFGAISMGSGWETLVYQKIGSVTTERPLIALKNDGNQSTGVIFGEGLWRWRLNEYATVENTEVFDKMLVKIAQFLSAKNDKRRFKAYPREKEYLSTDNIVFETELYNDLYEPLYGQNIELKLSREGGKTSTYTFTNAQGYTSFDIGNLPSGIYNYTAKAGTENYTGKFTVRSIQLENINTTANHQVLRNMSAQTGAITVKANDIDKLEQELSKRIFNKKVFSDEELTEFIHIKWVLIMLLLLVSVEWFIRKYFGGY